MIGRLQLIGGGVALSLAMTTGAYFKGRIDGYQSRDDEQVLSDFAALQGEMARFRVEMAENQNSGLQAADIVAGVSQSIGGLSSEISRLGDGSVCILSPDADRLLDEAVDQANSALRAARDQLDGASGASAGSDGSGDD